MKKKDWLVKTLVTLFVLVGILTVSCLLFYKTGTFSLESLTLVVSVCDVLSAIVAGAFIVVQLRSDNDADLKRAKTEEAKFILDYNMAFIENKELCEIEHYLEDAITHQGKGNISCLQEARQKLVNYLVYLEGFASCVQQGILEIEDIDNLFSYRFFLAMNHPEVQRLEILPFADFYRGNYQLYDQWYRYRMKSRGKDYINDIDSCEDVMPLANNALFRNCNYEMYLNDSIRISLKAPVNDEEGFVAIFKYNGCLYQYSDKTGITTFNEESNHSKSTVAISKDKELMRRIQFCITKKKNTLQIMDLEGEQLSKDSNITDDQYQSISELIYYTDPYIYPALFGEGDAGVENAKMLIPELIKSDMDTMFKKNNIYIYTSKGSVIGLILWHKGRLDWDSSHMCREADKQNINLNMDNVKKVKKQYISTRYEEEDNTIELINVCVSEEFRGLGISKLMLRDFVKEHFNENMRLCVLSNNESAKNLYKEYGFELIGHSEGFSLDESKPSCDDMIKRC